MTVIIQGRLEPNVLFEDKDITKPAIKQVKDGDLVVVWYKQNQSSSAQIYKVVNKNGEFSFGGTSTEPVKLENLKPPLKSDEINGDDQHGVYPLKLSLQILMPGKYSQPLAWENLTVAKDRRDSVTEVFAEHISNSMQALETPLVLEKANLGEVELAGRLIGQPDWANKLDKNYKKGDKFSAQKIFKLNTGSDGKRPEASEYEGHGDEKTSTKSGLKSLEDLEEISIVASPGYSHNWGSRRSEILSISNHLINHCEKMRYRVAILDSPNDQSLFGVREYRALLDNKRSAFYYPWVQILDPISNQEIYLPPSGFIAGIYARNDIEIGVHKAPANEVVRGAIGLETLLNKAQQDVLNPLGINCIRFFEGRGIRVWGARTISSDPEWKYLNIRRYFVYLERSIERSTQWAVFEPNGDQLWANVRRSVESFLENEWKEGRLFGAKVEQAFFVRCDRSTMTQNDIDNGRMICLIGVAPLYPAEFVIFRIGQWTANARR
jgi:phage tail sheath protein FI